MEEVDRLGVAAVLAADAELQVGVSQLRFVNKWHVDAKDNREFVRLDQEGVGALMRIGVQKGRSVRANLKICICGEHGGEPSSVEFCHREALDYVSCSPYRVPIARVAAAQAALRDKVKVGVTAQ